MRSKVHSVRERVAALRLELLAPTPEGLEAHLPALALAADQLRASNSGAPVGELRSLARELENVQKLIAHGLVFQQGWARLLAGSLSGYCPDGEPSPLQAPGQISVTG